MGRETLQSRRTIVQACARQACMRYRLCSARPEDTGDNRLRIGDHRRKLQDKITEETRIYSIIIIEYLICMIARTPGHDRMPVYHDRVPSIMIEHRMTLFIRRSRDYRPARRPRGAGPVYTRVATGHTGVHGTLWPHRCSRDYGAHTTIARHTPSSRLHCSPTRAARSQRVSYSCRW